jgi:Arc/MetJ family transcription regulator
MEGDRSRRARRLVGRVAAISGPFHRSLAELVYRWCMGRTNIDIDEEACRVVMDRYHLSSKREAVNYALRLVAGEALGLEQARMLRGAGWDGDLDEMRSSRAG